MLIASRRGSQPHRSTPRPGDIRGHLPQQPLRVPEVLDEILTRFLDERVGVDGLEEENEAVSAVAVEVVAV